MFNYTKGNTNKWLSQDGFLRNCSIYLDIRLEKKQPEEFGLPRKYMGGQGKTNIENRNTYKTLFS